VGIAVSLAGSFALTCVLEKMLFDIGSSEALTFVGATLVLTSVAGFASLIPALRAARVDPVTALRQE
jgi:putative ABC transport system permease protein